MSPRSNYPIFMASVFICLFFTGIYPALGQDLDQNTEKNYLIQFYQDHISAADGNRCSMYPSCSEYSARAFKKHGAVMGWIMSFDRLLRCGGNEAVISPSRIINGESHIFDPVESNDFWWFNKSQKGIHLSK